MSEERRVHNFGTKMLVSSRYVLYARNSGIELPIWLYWPIYYYFSFFFQALFLRTPWLLHTLLHSIGKQAHFKSRPHFSRPSAFLRLLKPRDCWLADYWSSGEKVEFSSHRPACEKVAQKSCMFSQGIKLIPNSTNLNKIGRTNS